MTVYGMYEKAKSTVKPLIPKWLFRYLINIYHLLEAIIASAINGFPARGMNFVGVTGTDGKTTTTLLLAEILDKAGYKVGVNSTAVHGMVGDLRHNEYELTTPSAFHLQKLLKELKQAGCEWVVMETASHALVQHRTWGLPYKVAVVTNLERDHLDYHHTMDEYAAAKAKLLRKPLEISVLNLDNEWYDYFARFSAANAVNFGTDQEADCRIVHAKLGQKGTKLELKLGEDGIKVGLGLPGKFNAYNALAAAATAYAMGVEPEHIKEGLESIDSIPGRMELIDVGQDFLVIVDYAHTAEALDTVFSTVNQTLKGGLISILGIGGDRDPGKRFSMGQVAAQHCKAVIVTDLEPRSEDPAQIRRMLREGAESEGESEVLEVADRTEAIKKAYELAEPGDGVIMTALGHQKYRQMTATEHIPWSEPQVARELLEEHLNKK